MPTIDLKPSTPASLVETSALSPRRRHLHRVLRLGPILVALLAVGHQTASGGTIRHDRVGSNYTNLAASYPSVGRLTWSSYICSATLIDDNWILTAGHCLDAEGYSPTGWTFDLTDSGGGMHNGAERVIHPDWTDSGGDLGSGADIALLRLGSAETTVAPATINTNTAEVGQVGTNVGYGRTGNGLTGDTDPAGTKRAGNNVVDLDGSGVLGYPDTVLFQDFDSGSAGDNWSGSAIGENLEYLIAPGDSGGGMFMDFGSGDVVAGVHSFIASVDGDTNADYGDIAGSTRVSSYASWITNTIGADEPVAPELGSWMIWAVVIGGGAAARGVRRRIGTPDLSQS